MANPPVHRIHNLKFVLLKGLVPGYRETIEVIERQGMRDLLRRKTGFQSPEFVLTSLVNLKDFAKAQAQVRAYQKTIESQALKLVKDDYNYFLDRLLVVVLDVLPTIEQQRSLIVGGFGSVNHFELRCSWRLRFVSV